MPDSDAHTATLDLPDQFSIRGRILGAEILHLTKIGGPTEATVRRLNYGAFDGFRAECSDGTSLAIISRNTTSLLGCDAVLRVQDASTLEAIQVSLRDGTASWLTPKAKRPIALSREECLLRAGQACSTWKPNFTLKAEEVSDTAIIIIYDDDGSGEVADIVAMRLSGQTLKVDLFHCKYSSGPTVGARVKDLYEVCGQAQKCIRWRERPDIFLAHLQRREASRRRASSASRFVHGHPATLNGWLNRWNDFSYDFSVTIVQPGYVKEQAEPAHLELFAATEALLMDTWGMRFRVIVSVAS